MSKDSTKENPATGKNILTRTILASVFILFVLLGIFSPIAKVNAAIGDACTVPGTGQSGILVANPADPSNPTCQTTATATTTPPDPNRSEFQKWATDESCGIIGDSSVAGCIKAIFYYVIYTPSAVLLAISATFFNALINISLNSTLFSTSSSFISTAWGVVRDLSNMFFILILLYIAFETILGMGGSKVKEMIGKVVIIALLINFSMFFTQVIIDSSNILALIFYNKLDVTYKDSTGAVVARPYKGATGAVEKDISGTMYNGFDVTSKLNENFWKQTMTTTDATGNVVKTENQIPVGTMVGIMIIASAIMLFASYAFLISGLAFVARLIELMVLIIFSPFAFMSSIAFSGISTIGWKDWLSRLIKASFMAPIFMFFMYLIFLLLNKNIFGSLVTVTSSWTQTILGVLIPGLLILVLLLKATDYAKKGSGVIGEMVMKGAKMAGGVALGVATGGAAVVGRASIGRAGAALANSEWAKKREAEGKFGSGIFRDVTKKMGSGSFDIRGAKIGGQTLASATGMKVGEAQKGGFEERKKVSVEKRQKRVKELEVGEDETLKQDLNKAESKLQDLLNENAHVIDSFDKMIEKKRQEVQDANVKFNAAKGTPAETAAKAALDSANGELDFAKQNKKDFRDGKDYMVTNSAGVTSIEKGTGESIDKLEKVKKEATQAIKNQNIERRINYAASQQTRWERTKGYVLSGGAYTKAASKEAAHRIRMETKLEDKGGH